ncbi:MAG: putative membrane protein YfcA [Halieaceae bacterium]|jgi:uncharacterized membrane protein YfcA
MTSTLAGVFGLGGGVLLIVLMPGFIPPGAILPLHAVVQLASNASRAGFDLGQIDRGIIPWVVLGGTLGTLIGGSLYLSIDLDLLPVAIGLVILLITWAPLPKLRGTNNSALVLLGFYQASLGMIAGATGPLGAAVLLQRDTRRDWLVINTAVTMAISHLLKIIAFMAMGFLFADYLLLMLALVIAVTVGSWAGTKLRGLVPEINFAFWFKLLLSALALRIIATALISQGI